MSSLTFKMTLIHVMSRRSSFMSINGLLESIFTLPWRKLLGFNCAHPKIFRLALLKKKRWLYHVNSNPKYSIQMFWQKRSEKENTHKPIKRLILKLKPVINYNYWEFFRVFFMAFHIFLLAPCEAEKMWW